MDLAFLTLIKIVKKMGKAREKGIATLKREIFI